MTDAPNQAPRNPGLRLRIALTLAALVAAAGAVALPMAASRGLELPTLAWVSMALAAAMALLWNSQWGLCFAAFAITPLGVVEHEIFGITLNLPETLILALSAKEAFRAVLRKESIVPYLPTRALAFYVCAALIAIATGWVQKNGPIRVLQDFRQFTEFILLFWLVLQRVHTRPQIVQIVSSYLAGATLVALHGIVQHYVPINVSPVHIASDLFLYNQVRSSSFYGATPLGGLMVLAVGPAVGLALTSARRSVKLLMVACICLCLVAVVYTLTRASWMAMAVSFVFIALSLRHSPKVIAITAAGAVIFAAALGPSIVKRVSALSISRPKSSIMTRAQYYAAAAHMIRANPILGLGWGCYYDIGEILVNERYVTTPRPPDAPDATVHSAYLQVFVKAGAFGLLGFLAILLAWAERVWRARKNKARHDRHYALFVGITAGVVGYLCHCAFENFFQWPVMSQSFWLLIGLSFRMAILYEAPMPIYGPRFALIGTAVAVFLLFMYGSLRIEAIGPINFERKPAAALAEGNLRKVLNIARNASESHPDDPMAHTVHGKVLLEYGEAGEALDRLDEALGLRSKEMEPWHRDTGQRYYFAPARLTLGKHYLWQNKLLDAVENFELARAYAVPADIEYSDFHTALYRAYAKQGLWARALEFGEPSDRELDGLESEDIARIARACEGVQNWKLVGRLAERLLTRGAFAAEAHYLLGRARLAQDRYEAALVHLEQAALNGRAHAAFFLGTALEKNGQPALAIQAFLRAPPGGLYRPFALAKVLTLLAGFREDGRAFATVTTQELLGQLDHEIAGMRLSQRPILYEDRRRLTLVAVMAPEAGFVSGGHFPILILWDDGQVSDAGPTGAPFSIAGAEDSVLLLRRTNSVLQLQWVENLVNWESVERLQTGAGAVPGWLDTARDWFYLRPGHAARIQKDDAGNSFLTIAELTWFYSVPVRVRDGDGYLLAGRVKRPKGDGGLGWQSLDENGHVLFEDSIFEQKSFGGWAWQAGYMRSQAHWNSLRVRLEASRNAGTVAFDDVMLVEIDEPHPTFLE